MISLRARIFIVISLIVFVVLSISIFLFVRSKKHAALKEQTIAADNLSAEKIDNNPSATASAPVAETNDAGNLKVNPVSSLDIQQNAAKQIAKIFLERFNSFSSESQYQNVRDVQTLVSITYWSQLSAKLPSTKAEQNITVPFSSTITKVYSVKLVEWSDQLATVDLQAKIMEEKNGVTKNIDKQAKVGLVSDGKNWLVDKFEWVK